jgi:acetyltransferase-like isoleucine patch superfamily enzyme
VSLSLIHPSAIIHPNVRLGEKVTVEANVILGSEDCTPLEIGDGALIRSGTRIYGGVRIAGGLRTGHNCLIRGRVEAGVNFRIGSYSSVEGTVHIGHDVTIQGRVEVADSYLHHRCRIWVGTYVCDNVWPPDGAKKPPVIGEDSRIFAGVIVMPGTQLGAGSVAAAGAVLCGEIPPGHLFTRDGRCVPLREPAVAA